MTLPLRSLIILPGLLAAATATAATPSFEASVTRELHLLREETAAVAAATEAAQKRADAERKKQSRALDKLTETLISLKHTNDVLSDDGQLAERTRTQPEREALLERTLSRVQNALKKQGSPLATQIPTHYELLPDAAAELLNRIALKGRLRVEKAGTYFGEQGTGKTADLLWLSEVSAIALAPEGGPLFTTEAHHLKLDTTLPKGTRHTIRATGEALLKSKQPLALETLLFDPGLPQNNHFNQSKSLFETLQSGGMVMWPILLLALAALGIIIERLWNLNLVHTNAENLMIEVDEFIQRGQWLEADQSCHRNPGVVARVMQAILDHRDLTREQMEDRATEVILSSRPSLERFLSGLNIIAAVAPLLGLLGTVTGMIATFLIITEHGTGDPRLMAGGISEALLTTQFGLTVAIPALMAHSLLNRWVEHILGDIETNSLKLLNSIERQAFSRTRTSSPENVLPISSFATGTADV